MIWRATGAVLGGFWLFVAIVAAVLVALLTSLTPSSGTGTRRGGAGPVAVADIPADYLALYVAAARTCPGLGWSVLAAVGKIESDHGRSTLPGVSSGANSAGAQGVMQFLPTTWAAVVARHPPPPGGENPPSPFNPHDAIYTAAAYLCDSGAGNPATLSASLFTYNHSSAYVASVLEQARRYAARAVTAQTPAAAAGGSGQAGTVAAAAIFFARAQLGLPYRWGGDGPDGFDCSGLTQAAYAAAGLGLPRTADQQFHAGPRLGADQPLEPGDLVFYSAAGAARITHVALYIGGNQVVQAPQAGEVISVAPLATREYTGATRPAAAVSSTTERDSPNEGTNSLHVDPRLVSSVAYSPIRPLAGWLVITAAAAVALGVLITRRARRVRRDRLAHRATFDADSRARSGTDRGHAPRRSCPVASSDLTSPRPAEFAWSTVGAW